MATEETYNRLRAARLRKGLSLNQLARLIGSSPQTLSAIEKRDTRRPRSIDLERLAEVLETTVEELFPETNR